jgi:hypothetical protein
MVRIRIYNIDQRTFTPYQLPVADNLTFLLVSVSCYQGLLSGMVGGSCGILPSWAPRRLQLGIVQPRLLTAGRVADPDPDWIRIQSGQWIRIRIRNPDPYTGGQKRPSKVEFFLKLMFQSVEWSLFRAEGSFCYLDVLYGGGLGIGKL